MGTLIKNEMIKLFSRKKTWVVFICFILLTGFITFGVYKECQFSKKYSSPEYKIQMYKESKERLVKDKEEIEKNPTQSKRNAMDIEQSIKEMDERIKLEEENLKKGTVDWKQQLKDDINDLEKSIESDQVPSHAKEGMKIKLKELKYLQEHNIKPAENYEFTGIRFVRELSAILGAIFLIIGILVFSTDMVSGECTPPTLKFLLIQPVSRGKVLLSKFIAIAISSLILILSTELLFFLGVGLFNGFGSFDYPVLTGTLYKIDLSTVENGVHPLMEVVGSTKIIPMWQNLINMLLLQGLFIITAVAFAFLISSVFKSSMVSMAVGIVSIIAIMVLTQAIGVVKKVAQFIFIIYGAPESLLQGNLAMQFNNVNMTTSTAIIVMIASTVVCYIISHLIFTKKDILI